MKLFAIYFIINITSLLTELIVWNHKTKQFIQLNANFERECQTNRLLINGETISWILYYHHGGFEIINQSKLTIRSFRIDQEGLAVCQIKDRMNRILDEKFVFLTNDPTDLIDERFEGFEQILIDTEINKPDRHCGPDKNIDFNRTDIADFHIDFIQHYERVRHHTNHIQISKIHHENEGYFECIVRLHNGLVGVRVFFLSVGGEPRQISNRETHIYSELHGALTLLCPIFSSVPAWYTFLTPDDSTIVGQDYLRIKHLTSQHSGLYKCRVTTDDDSDGYSLTADLYLDVYGPPEYIEPYLNEYNFISTKKSVETTIRCSLKGNPPAIYQWFLGDISTDSHKEIVSQQIDYVITPDKNTTITCIAKNNRGIQRQVYVLQIID